MAWMKIRQFGELLVPQKKEFGAGQEDNLGTGRALTSWQQLPDGTFFDNYYGVERRPQGIRPVTKEGVIYGADADEIEDTIDYLRAHIGAMDKLTVQMRSGDLRWQWAVFKEVDTPAPSGRPTAVPMQLTWETAAQHWYGLVNTGDGWTVGDDSFTLGDGTAELGQNSYTYTLTVDSGSIPQNFNLTHRGNIPATNLIIRVTAGTTDITYLRIRQVTSTLAYGPWEIYYYQSGLPPILAAGETLVIDCGALNITNDGDDAYADLFWDWPQWLRLEANRDGTPKLNQIYVYVDGNANADATVSFEWYDHYA